MKKIFILFSLSGILFSCGSSKTEEKKTNENPGMALYSKNCEKCHGDDGKQMTAGAKDLSVSVIPSDEISQIIANGKGGMPGYSSTMKPEEIKLVSEFVLTLRK